MVIELNETLGRSLTDRAKASGCDSASQYVERVLERHVVETPVGAEADRDKIVVPEPSAPEGQDLVRRAQEFRRRMAGRVTQDEINAMIREDRDGR